MMMDELFDDVTPSNSYISDSDKNIKEENLTLELNTDTTFENVVVVKTENSSENDTPSSYTKFENMVKTESLPESSYIPDVINIIKDEERIEADNLSETFSQSNIDVTEIVKTECSYKTQIPFTDVNIKLEENVKYESSSEMQSHCAGTTDIKLEENIKADNLSVPETYLDCTDVEVKKEESTTAESSNDIHVNAECGNEMKVEPPSSLESPFVKLEENSNTRCDESVPQAASASQVMAACVESGQGVHIVNESEPPIEIDVDEASESYCDLPTSSDNSIQEKRLTHSTIDPECQNISNEKFDSLEDTNTHSKNKKAGGKAFECLMCGKLFSYRCHLQRHNKSHNGEKPYQCLKCGKGFTSRSYLQIHNRIHSGEKPYQCTDCGKTFTENSNLQKHKRSHSGERPYECEICGKRFFYKSNMEAHKKTHSGEKKPFECLTCGKLFIHPSHLQYHNRIHSGEKPYQCLICEKAFKRKSELQIHERTHSGEKPYECQLCGKAFITSSNLQTHKRTHSGERPESSTH